MQVARESRTKSALDLCTPAPPQPKGEVKCTMPMDCLRPASGAALCFDIVHAKTRDRTGDLQIFSLMLSQLSYRGSWRISFAKVKRQDSIGAARIQGAALEVKPLHLFRAQGGHAETRDRTGDLQIFSLTLSQLSYRGFGRHGKPWIVPSPHRPFTLIGNCRVMVC